jgi:hypothetical protein
LCLWLLLHFHGLHNQSSRIPHQWNRTSCFDDDRVHGGIHVRNWSVLAAWAGKGHSCTKPWARFLAPTRGWMFRFLPNVSHSFCSYYLSWRRKDNAGTVDRFMQVHPRRTSNRHCDHARWTS